MKSISNLFLFGVTIILAACSGSETYRGEWKATNSHGAKLNITFEPNSLTIKDSTGNTINTSEYSQNSVKIENSIETYGISLGDGRRYQINFPKADDETVGVIKDGNGLPLYTISRNNYVRYEDIYSLY